MRRIDRIGILGAGAWGSALALLAAANGRKVIVWTSDRERARRMETERVAPRLNDAALPDELAITSDVAPLAEVEALILAVPAQALAGALKEVAGAVPRRVACVIAAKGVEQASGRLLSEVVGGALPDAPVFALSGPSFASDVAVGLPTAVTLAGADQELAETLREVLARPNFRPYLARDLVGVQLGGAVKNVLAIAAGAAVGRGLGSSARAALIACGFAEMARLVRAMGGAAETVAGLSGLGDLVLSATDAKSRNYSFGLALGAGRTVEEALAKANGVVEGVATAAALRRLAAERHVEMPISEAVARVLAGEARLDQAVGELLARPLTAEAEADRLRSRAASPSR